MAEKGYTVVAKGWGWEVVKWAALALNDTGTPYVGPFRPDKSVQVEGTFGAGGTVGIEGSNMDATETYRTLNDPQGNTLAVTTAKIEQLLENPLKIRPNVTAGDGTTSLNVYLLATKLGG